MTDLRLWYKQPAKKWTQALMIGNGRLGGMIFGKTDSERIQLNEDTLWAGYPRDDTNPGGMQHLQEVRDLIMAGKYQEAESIIDPHMVGVKAEPYSTLADLFLTFHHKSIKNYKRWLDLSTAISGIEYTSNDIVYKRELFASFPDQAIIIHLTANKANSISFSCTLTTKLNSEIHADLQDKLGIITGDGRAPAHVDTYSPTGKIEYHPQKGMRFRVQTYINVVDGTISQQNNAIEVKNATECTLTIVAATSFVDYKTDPFVNGKDEKLLCQSYWNNIKNKKITELTSNHIEDYQKLFNRVIFDLEGPNFDYLPTDKRLARLRTAKGKYPIVYDVFMQIKRFLKISSSSPGDRFWNASKGFDDPQLIVLYLQFGRYLLIASSRPGTQPANLQGIWNESLRPPWGSNYTTNINLQMNYWPVETCNLSDCFEPLEKFIIEVAENGKKTAQVNYGCNGWTLNHNSNLWRVTTPSFGNPCWSYFPVGGGWICFHMWEHFLFTQDHAFLEQIAYPIMEQATIFLLEWIYEGPNKHLITCPSTSPENAFIEKNGEKSHVHYASTCDMAIIKQHMQNYLNAANLLKRTDPVVDKTKKAIEKLVPYKIGADGRLQEWYEDFEDSEPGHRHMSHLIGVFPGFHITPELTADLTNAIKKTLEKRINIGGGGTGWSCGWKVNIFARLKDAKNTYNSIATIIKDSTYDNMFDAHPPFQIDGNFGATSGIAEMLVQSHNNLLDILPALPSELASGEIIGLRLRGNGAINIKWQNGFLEKAEVIFSTPSKMAIKYSKSRNYSLFNSQGQKVSDITNDLTRIIEFKEKQIYTISKIN